MLNHLFINSSARKRNKSVQGSRENSSPTAARDWLKINILLATWAAYTKFESALHIQ
jgi:hypothetical protein